MKKNSASKAFYFCSLPWTGFSNDPSGQVRPCCIYQDVIKKETGEPYYVQTSSLTEILSSPYMRALRDEFRAGQRPVDCSSCWRDEDFGKKSKRSIYQKQVDYSIEPAWPKELQLIISNTCNLKCRTCAPTHSTTWTQEAIDRDRMWMPPSPGPIISEKSVFWNERSQWLKSVEQIEIVGGEPFLIKGWMDIWSELVAMGRSKEVTIQMSTNVTVFKPEVVRFLIENFKFVGIGLSVDGVGSRFNYMRHPGKWNAVEKNISGYCQILQEKHPNFNTQVTHTISWMNMFYVPSFHDYFFEKWPELKVWNNIVYHPEHLSGSALPDSAKDAIEKEILSSGYRSRFKADVHRDLLGILEFIRSVPFSKDVFERGLFEIKSGDKYRKETYQKIFLEFLQSMPEWW